MSAAREKRAEARLGALHGRAYLRVLMHMAASELQDLNRSLRLPSQGPASVRGPRTEETLQREHGWSLLRHCSVPQEWAQREARLLRPFLPRGAPWPNCMITTCTATLAAAALARLARTHGCTKSTAWKQLRGCVAWTGQG